MHNAETAHRLLRLHKRKAPPAPPVPVTSAASHAHGHARHSLPYQCATRRSAQCGGHTVSALDERPYNECTARTTSCSARCHPRTRGVSSSYTHERAWCMCVHTRHPHQRTHAQAHATIPDEQRDMGRGVESSRRESDARATDRLHASVPFALRMAYQLQDGSAPLSAPPAMAEAHTQCEPAKSYTPYHVLYHHRAPRCRPSLAPQPAIHAPRCHGPSTVPAAQWDSLPLRRLGLVGELGAVSLLDRLTVPLQLLGLVLSHGVVNHALLLVACTCDTREHARQKAMPRCESRVTANARRRNPAPSRHHPAARLRGEPARVPARAPEGTAAMGVRPGRYMSWDAVGGVRAGRGGETRGDGASAYA